MQHDPLTGGRTPWWGTIQRVLLEPTAVDLDPGLRLQASMLTAFLLLIVTAMMVQALNPYTPDVRRISVALVGSVMLCSYSLRWTKYYWLMGPIAVILVAVPPFLNTVRGLDPNDSLKWLAITLLTGGLWLPARLFAIQYVIILGSVLVLPFFLPGTVHGDLAQVYTFLILTGFLMMSSVMFRTQDRNRIDRQTRELLQEISERKAAEAELQRHKEKLELLVTERTTEVRENQKLLQGIMDHSPAVIYVKDRNGRYHLVNPLFYDLFHLNKESVIGRTDHDIFPKKIADEFRTNDLVVLETGQMIESEETAVLEDGAHWYISLKFPLRYSDGKPDLVCGISTDITGRKRVQEELRTALAEVQELKNRLQAENLYLQEEIKLDHNFSEIITRNKAMTEVLHRVEQAARTDVTVLIQGETGTGKELVARAVHEISRRKDRPLVKVNCAALPESLIESELFGHEKGAFTGASERKRGRFELANGGTLFLDEIGELPISLQAKLLRVLQEGEFERLGSGTTIRVDARVIAATNHDLAMDVEEGKFRGDLYYRLSVFPITCPPLRNRMEDIPLLVQHFVAKHGAKAGKKIERIQQSAINAFQAYDWPGNIRELENLVERALITSPQGEFRLEEWFVPKNREPAAEPDGSLFSPRPLHEALTELKRAYISRTLEQVGGVQRRAAEILRIQPAYLNRLMKDLGIVTRKQS